MLLLYYLEISVILLEVTYLHQMTYNSKKMERDIEISFY
jgi:hypothetical protein